uniref:NECAP-like protein CG9132 n=1 Tax=Caligus rogercresseyi TaxID=217165 RepID=C1BQ28_CALRO|nr:NECAP-like protein CG9132 [Caligus rogercresseyi]|eukprot:TRINITY_DN1435_c0_g1_i2.p2 TRINITY_DN1435_c0_g1~~TRINITY_DN1435_c0_g1_i2.p2  ORF type:complete len:249 (-),score=71.73 TRINITY_DN1435_c0_g1_i2:223-969(-)
MDEIERCMLVKNEVHVYKIPPRSTARGYRAANWSLATPDWTGRLRAMARGKSFELRLEDKNSGELFAACPVEQYPGTSVEAVLDSSRYFVLCIQDKDRRAYIGIGFADRADSFDLNVVLHDHFKWIKRQEEEKAAVASGDSEDGTSSKPSLDLSLKEGQTFHINIPKKDGVRSVSKNNKPGGGFILPPPSSSSGAPRIAPPPGETPVTSPTDPSVISRNLLDAEEDEDWGEFKGGSSSVQPSGNWVTF